MNVKNVPVLVLVLLVDAAHERRRWGQDLLDEDEDGLLGRQLDALADDIDELAHRQVGRDQILLLIDCRDVRLLNLLANDLLGGEERVSKHIHARGCSVAQGSSGRRRLADRTARGSCLCEAVRDKQLRVLWEEMLSVVKTWKRAGDEREVHVREYGRRTSGGCARPRPCASRRGARP